MRNLPPVALMTTYVKKWSKEVEEMSTQYFMESTGGQFFWNSSILTSVVFWSQISCTIFWKDSRHCLHVLCMAFFTRPWYI